MRVKLLQPHAPHAIGDVLDASDATGQKWIENGKAVKSKEPLTRPQHKNEDARPPVNVVVHTKFYVDENLDAIPAP